MRGGGGGAAGGVTKSDDRSQDEGTRLAAVERALDELRAAIDRGHADVVSRVAAAVERSIEEKLNEAEEAAHDQMASIERSVLLNAGRAGGGAGAGGGGRGLWGGGGGGYFANQLSPQLSHASTPKPPLSASRGRSSITKPRENDHHLRRLELIPGAPASVEPSVLGSLMSYFTRPTEDEPAAPEDVPPHVSRYERRKALREENNGGSLSPSLSPRELPSWPASSSSHNSIYRA